MSCWRTRVFVSASIFDEGREIRERKKKKSIPISSENSISPPPSSPPSQKNTTSNDGKFPAICRRLFEIARELSYSFLAKKCAIFLRNFLPIVTHTTRHIRTRALYPDRVYLFTLAVPPTARAITAPNMYLFYRMTENTFDDKIRSVVSKYKRKARTEKKNCLSARKKKKKTYTEKRERS